MKTLLVTVDSLRKDHFKYMTSTRGYLDTIHDRAFAPSTATIGSFPGIIGGEFANGAGLTGDSVVTRIDEHSIGLTTNHLLSEEYGYDEGFDVFDSPKGGGNTVKDKAAIHLTRGSLAYQVASWGWNQYQRLISLFSDVEKSFRPADDVVSQFNSEIKERDDWFGWLHFMEPHHPYDPDGGELGRAEAQRLTRKVLSGNGSQSDRRGVQELYRLEVAELDRKLANLWELIPDDTRVVFCADHGELLGEDGMWGHPGEMRSELLHVPFGTKNAPELGQVVSLIDVPSILLGSEYGLGELDRDTAFATYGDKKAAINIDNIATESGSVSIDEGEPIEDPSLERSLERFEPDGVVKKDGLEEDLEELGYL